MQSVSVTSLCLREGVKTYSQATEQTLWSTSADVTEPPTYTASEGAPVLRAKNRLQEQNVVSLDSAACHDTRNNH